VSSGVLIMKQSLALSYVACNHSKAFEAVLLAIVSLAAGAVMQTHPGGHRQADSKIQVAQDVCTSSNELNMVCYSVSDVSQEATNAHSQSAGVGW
jgi:hypothetical protein